MATGTVRVFLADDHPLVRVGVRVELAKTAGAFVLAGEAETGAALLALLAVSRPGDLLITDFCMPSRAARACDGLSLLSTLARQWPDVRTIVLTDVDNPALLRAIAETGVRGIVAKAAMPQDLIQALRRVAVDKIHYCRVTRVALDDADCLAHLPQMSPRETEVVRLFVNGMTVSAIAMRLSRSVKTISRQKSDAMRKLGVENDCQLYAYARDHGLTR
jgi:two-component system capsular synthesis response regulator RcsB